MIFNCNTGSRRGWKNGLCIRKFSPLDRPRLHDELAGSLPSQPESDLAVYGIPPALARGASRGSPCAPLASVVRDGIRLGSNPLPSYSAALCLSGSLRIIDRICRNSESETVHGEGRSSGRQGLLSGVVPMDDGVCASSSVRVFLPSPGLVNDQTFRLANGSALQISLSHCPEREIFVVMSD